MANQIIFSFISSISKKITFSSIFFNVVIAMLFIAFSNAKDVTASIFNIPDGDSAALIAAINTANSTTGPDTINLAADSKYILAAIDNVDNGLPTINGDIIINGYGSSIERDSAIGTALFRILFINPTGKLTLNSITIAGAHIISRPGGGIFNAGTLKLVNTSVVTNKADGGAGIYNINGHLELLNSTISGNIDRFYGAGIWNHGFSAVTTLIDSSISGNSGRLRGTGIYNLAGAVTLIRSLVNNNSNGAGIMNHNFQSKLTLINSTVSGNTHNPIEGGGGIVNIGTFAKVLLINSTIVDNTHFSGAGGVINGGGMVILKNTIIANNSPSDLFGIFTTLGHNLFKSPGSASIVGSGVGDIGGLDPLLGPLASNGGATATYLPLPSSPVVDVIFTADCTDELGVAIITDQRGIRRPQGSACDIGAVETSTNQSPIANAGADQNIFLTQTALLDGSGSSDPEGSALTYLWAIDSAPVGSTAALSCTTCITPNLTPDIAGTYIVSLVVNDGSLDSAAATVSVSATQNLPPVAAATGSPLTGLLPLAVSFTAGASYDPEAGSLTYSWDFGDPSSGSNNTSSIMEPGHTYHAAGTYNAVVTVTDDFNQTDQAAVEIVVTAPNLPPTVAPTATPSSGAAPLGVQFTANASDEDATLLNYSWNFGDGGTSAETNPVHTYAVAGTYTATVSVSDGVNSPVVSNDLVISVDSPLSISITESKVDYGKKGKVKGKISLKADFTYPGTPATLDVIKVVFDGMILLEAPFSSFEEESDDPGEFEYESENVHAKIDFTKMTIKVSRHKMLLGTLDVSNGIDVVIYFGAHSANDHFIPKVKVKKPHDEDDEKEMSHKK